MPRVSEASTQPGRAAASADTADDRSTRCSVSRRRIRLCWSAFVLALGVWLSGAPARAQELGQAGNLVFSAERLFGMYFASREAEFENGIERDLDFSVVGLGWGPPGGLALLTVPRLGIDYFLTPNLTLGGNFGLAAIDSEADNDDIALLFAGRVGYALRLSNAISFWPRGGLSLALLGGDSELSVFAFTLEGMFTLAPSDGWAFLAGPVLDLGFVGAYGDDVDYTEIIFGVMFGIAGWVDI